MASEFVILCIWRAVLTSVNPLCLTINLLKSNKEISLRGTLTAYSCLGAISASVSMVLSDKEVLAARSLVISVAMFHVRIHRGRYHPSKVTKISIPAPS
jgi:hypothetical protein